MSEKQEKKSVYKKWWFWVLAVIIIGSWFVGNDDDEDVAKESDKAEEVVTEQEETEDEEQEESKVKDEKVEEESNDDRTIVEIIEEDYDIDKATIKEGLLTIEKDPGTIWDENSLFYTVYDLFEIMHEAFKDDSIDEVEAKVLTTMIDNKGNESVDAVIEYIYTRETFEELNYDNFSNMAYGEQWRILNESDLYMIHPGIYNNLKDKYKDNLIHGTSKFPPVE